MQNKIKLKEKHVQRREKLHQEFPPAFYLDFGQNMQDSCAAFQWKNKWSTTSFKFYCISSAKQYPEQRITKWVTAKNDRLIK